MRLDTLPRSMVVLGGGFIAAEMSHIFGSLGTRVTIIARSGQLLAVTTSMSGRGSPKRMPVASTCGSAQRPGECRQQERDPRRPSHALRPGAGRRPGAPSGDRSDTEQRRPQCRRGRDRRRRPRPCPHRRHLRHERTRHLGPRRPGQPFPAQAHGQRRDPAHPLQPAAPPAAPEGGLYRRTFSCVRRPSGRLRGRDRAGPAGPGPRLHSSRPSLQRHRLRLGAGGHRQLREDPR